MYLNMFLENNFECCRYFLPQNFTINFDTNLMELFLDLFVKVLFSVHPHR